MERLARIAFLCEGNAETYHAFSGTAKSIVGHLREIGHDVRTFDIRLPRLQRILVAGRSVSSNRSRWRARFRYGKHAFAARSELARRMVMSDERPFDVVFQIGPTSAPPLRHEMPYVLYCDWNMGLSIENSKNASSAAHGLVSQEAERINRLHAEVYRGAATIFTISEMLRQSFPRIYDIPDDRVVRAYPGANLHTSMLLSRPAMRPGGHRPTVLFIAREFHRKGGDTLLRAFSRVREQLPDARLLVIGTDEIGVERPAGVEVIGSLRKDVPEELERLSRAFVDSDVFCLPSRMDPFPNVVREAMLMSLPCVTTNVCAFPEMVVDGQTGYTVPVDDERALATALARLLGDAGLAMKMGEAGRKRAEELFRWDKCASIISRHIQLLTAEPVAPPV